MNSTGGLSNSQRGSMNANEWATKRKEQIERAKQLREERKLGSTGNNALKSMGQDLVHNRSGSHNGRSQQHTPHSQQPHPQINNQMGAPNNNNGDMSVLSSPSLQQMNSASNRIYQSQGGYPPAQQNGYRQQYHQEFNTDFMPPSAVVRSSSLHGQNHQLHQSSMPQNGQQHANKMSFEEYMRQNPNPVNGQQQYQPQPGGLNQSYSQITRTSDNYFTNQNNQPNYSQQQMMGAGLSQQPSMQGGSLTPLVGGANDNFGMRGQGGTLQNASPRTQNNFGQATRYSDNNYTSRNSNNAGLQYSTEDVANARGSLQLLKKRMSSREKQVQSSADAIGGGGRPAPRQSNTQRQPPNPANFNHVPKPPRSNVNDTIDSQSNVSGNGRNQNYRRVFKPGSSQPPAQHTSSYNSNTEASTPWGPDSIPDGNGYMGKQQNSAGGMHTRKQNSIEPPPKYEYEPERRVQPTRSINKPPQSKRPMQVDMNVNDNANYPSMGGGIGGGGGQSGYDFENVKDPFGGGGARAVQNTPPQGQRKAGGLPPKPKTNFQDEFAAQGLTHGGEQPEEYGEVGNLIPCHSCGRKFNPVTLAKHTKICQKVFVEKRKQYNAAENRQATDASGKGIDEDPWEKKRRLQQQKKQEAKQPAKPEGKIPKWKLQSMQFRQAVGPVGGAKADPMGGGGASNFNPTQDMSAIDVDDRQQCRFCGRKFNETAYERHVVHCETKHKAQQMKMGGKAGGGLPPAKRNVSKPRR